MKNQSKKESDIKKAEADAAYKIQEEEQRRTIEIATSDANIAKQEKEIELKQKETEVMEKTLDATVNKNINITGLENSDIESKNIIVESIVNDNANTISDEEE